MKKAPAMKKIPSSKTVKDNDYKVKEGVTERTFDPRPEFSVTDEILPAIKDWSVGKKYRFEVEVEMIGSRIEDWGDDKGKLKGNFKISGIMVDHDKNEDDEEPEFPESMRIKK